MLENLQLATFARKDKAQIARDLEQVLAIFPRLDERKHQKSGTMSGGEQQMLAVGRAFMSARRFMILDEPSMGLAPLLMKAVFDALKEIVEDNGENILVAYNFKSDLARLQKAFPKAVTLSRSGEEVEAWNRGEISMLLLGP